MGIKKFIEDLGEKREEFIGRASQCSSAEELLSLVKEYGVVPGEKQLEELLEFVKNSQCRLRDEELDAVAGGCIIKMEFGRPEKTVPENWKK